jgi:hypothetical protein
LQNQGNSAHQSKRRKLAKEDHPAWAEVKNLKYQDYQITPGQQDILSKEASWFTPDNIAQYQTGPETDEQLKQEAPVFNGQGQDHPPLSSPEMGPSSQNESQFHTQALAPFAQSQTKGELEVEEVVEEVVEKVVEEVVEEASVEKVLEWDPTPPPESPAPVATEEMQGDVEPEAEESLDWEESPPRPKKTTMVTSIWFACLIVE